MTHIINPVKSVFWAILTVSVFLFSQNAWSSDPAPAEDLITGRITTLSGDGIAGVCVDAFVDKCGSDPSVADTMTDDYGDYSLYIPAGSQAYIFANGDCPQDKDYVRVYYDGGSGSALCQNALPVSGGDTVNFTLPQAGAVSGTVVESDGTTPIPDLHVYVESEACNGVWLGGANTDAEGNYTITGIPEGTVIVGACPDCNDLPYAEVWYDGGAGTTECDQAADVQVTAGQTTENIDFQLEPAGSISGTLTDMDGNPITDALISVHATPVDGTWGGLGTYVSQSDGSFTINGLVPGQYKIEANNNRDNQYVTKYFPDSISWESAQTITVIAEQVTPEINFQLDIGGTISGTVLDDQGEPIENLYVNADLHDQYGNWLFGTGSSTSTDGTYTITGLPEGDYRIVASGNGYVQGYYNDTPDWDQAELVHVEAGTSEPDYIDFNLEKGASISGTIYLSDGSTPAGEGIEIIALQGEPCGHQEHYAWAQTDSNGNYTLNGVPAGDIYLKTDNNNQSNYLNEWWNETESSWECQDAQALSVSQNDDINGYDFQLDAGATISGTVYENDGVTPIQGLHVYVTPEACEGAWGIGRETDEFGNYTIPGIPGNAVYVRACPNCSGHDYIDEWYDGDGGSGTTDCNQAVLVPITGGQTTSGIDFTLEYPIIVTINNIHNPDNTFTTTYDIFFLNLHNFDSQRVVNITVIDPSGTPIHQYSRDEATPDHFAYVDRWKWFSFSDPGTQPALGEYSFNIITDDFTTVVKQHKTINKAIPVVDTSTMFPADNALIDDRFPVFQWGDVDNTPYPVFHRLKIFDHTGYRIYASGWDANLRSAAMPEGLLQPGQSYTWEVSIYDHNDWTKVENLSTSERFSFTMADTLSSNHPAKPAIDLDYWGAVSWRRSDIDATSMWIKVIDHDGIAHDGSSHQVSVSFNGETHPLSYARSDSAFEAYYEYWDGATPAPAGDYVFTVTDPDGNTATVIDTLEVNPLPFLDPNTFGIIDNGTSPTFTWDALPGAVRYRVRIYDMNWNVVWDEFPLTQPNPSCTLPPGILLPNTHYRYRIETRDSHSSFDTDNVSVSGNMPFTTGDESVTPFINASSDAHIWSASDMGTTLIFYSRIHDAQGVPDNIRSVTAEFPDGSSIPLYLYEKESLTSGIYYNEDFTLPIAPGDYTITVENLDGYTYAYSDTLDVDPVGYPADDTITAAVSGTQVDVTWEEVTGAAFYRLELYDIGQNRIHTFTTAENTYTIPEGYLKENTFYRYRITAWREFFHQGVDNAARSGLFNLKRSFVTAPVPGTAVPQIDLNGKGAFVTHSTEPAGGQSTYHLEFTVSVTDMDGVPENISHVRVIYPDGVTTRDLWLDGSPSPGATSADFSFYETYDNLQDIQEGPYEFEVMDHAGSKADITDTLAVDPIAVPGNTLPADGAIVPTTTPVISWDPVPGADRYKIILYQDVNTKIHEAADLSSSSFTIPGGLLETRHAYNYKIYAYKEGKTDNLNNMSQIAWGRTGPFFTVDTNAIGSLSGTILDTQGQPVENLKIEVWSDKCWNTFLGQAYTDTVGKYIIENLPPEEVYVRTCAECDNINFVDVWWDGADGSIDCSLATGVLIPAYQTTSDIDFQLTVGATVSGTLFQADGQSFFDQPVHINVHQGDPCRHYDHVAGTTIDPATGEFTITGVPAGQFHIKIHNADDTNAVARWWNSSGGDYDCDQAELISLSEGQVLAGLTFTTQAGGSVSGTVYEIDGSTAIHGNWGVNAIRTSDGHWVEGSDIQADGTYRITGLLPGEYYILAHPDTGHVQKYYDNVLDMQQADVITITATENITDIDFALETGGTVSGTVYEANGTTPIPDLHLFAQSQACGGFGLGGTNTDKDGNYVLGGLPAGTVHLYACPSCDVDGKPFVDGFYNGDTSTRDCTQAMDIPVTAGQTTSGINFKLEPGVSVSGTLFLPDGTTPFDQPVHVNVYQGDPCGHHDHVAGTVVDPTTGTFTITGVPPGQYYIKMNNSNSEPTNVVERWWNSNGGAFLFDCSQAELITVTEGQDLNELTFTTQTGTNVSGTVYEHDGVTPIAGDWGVIAQRTSDQRFMGGSHIASDGTYEIKGLPPGDYFIRAETSSTPHAIEFYDNAATAQEAAIISVTGAEEISGIDFTLEYPLFIDIMSTHRPDNTFSTWYGIYFFNFHNFDLDKVVSITMKDPSGTERYHYTRAGGDQNDFVRNQWHGFHVSVVENQPPLGEYTFDVVTDDFTTTVRKTRTVNKTMPIVDASTMSPADNATVDARIPVFEWQAVENPEMPVFYRIQVFDDTGYRVYASQRVADLYSIALPEGVLQPGKTYTWGIYIYDTHDGNKVENSSASHKLSFTMADTLLTSHAAQPAIDLDGWGAVSWRNNNNDATSLWIKVIDHDGIAHDGSSHQVTATFNGETHPLYLSRSNSAFEAYYEYWDGATPAPEGDYVFTVTDPAGNTATATDTRVEKSLAIPDQNSLGIIPNGTSPTFTWDAVEGAARYQVRIRDMNWNTVWNGYPETTDDLSYTVPPGILQPNTRYRYHIRARESHYPFIISNNTASGDILFTTGEESVHPLIEIADGASTWTNVLTGTYLSFWIKIHDAQGVPDNIKSVTATFPDGTTIPLYFNHTESPFCGIYQGANHRLPITQGDYTITVEDRDGNTHSITDTLNVDPVGYPSDDSIVATVNGTQVDLTWDAVPDALFYRVELYDMNDKRSHAFGTTRNTYTIPEGYLEENTVYRYRITTRKEYFDHGVDNASSSGMGHLKKSFVTTSAPGEAPPEINLDEEGAYVVHFKDPDKGQSRYLLEFVVSVADPDGVPENIAHVRVTYPDGTPTRELLPDGSLTPGATRASYTFYEPLDTLQDIQEGTYTFEVMDHDGLTASITDTLDVDPIPVPAGSQPSDDSVIRTTTPLISWQPVPGAGHYKVIIFQDWNTKIHEAADLTTNYYQVPEGILATTGKYSYRIHAYKQGEQTNLDNMSINQLYISQRPHFSIDDPGPAVPGDFDNNDSVDLADMIPVLRALTDKPPEQSIHLPSDVDGDNKAGIIDTIYILQKTIQGPKE